MPGDNASPAALAATARKLLEVSGRAALSTLLTREGASEPASGKSAWPYTSLVQVAVRAQDASMVPLLLISDLAEHTRNLRADPRVSLLLEDPDGAHDPLANARLTLIGRALPSGDADDKRYFVERHPSAALYAGFADFSMWRVQWERAHLVAGFGRIRWMTRKEIVAG